MTRSLIDHSASSERVPHVSVLSPVVQPSTSRGKGVAIDYQKAAEFFTLAAIQGEPRSQAALGIMYTIGQGVPIDRRKAKLWYQLSCDRDFKLSCEILADLE